MEHQAKWSLLRVLMMILLFTPLVFLRSALYLLPASVISFLRDPTPTSPATGYEACCAGIQLEHSDELYYQVGNVSYFTPTDTAITGLSFASSSAVLSSALHPSTAPFPIAVLHVSVIDCTIGTESLSEAMHTALELDDVVSSSWLDTIVLQTALGMRKPEHLAVDRAFRMLLDRYHVRRILLAENVRLSGSSWLNGIHIDTVRPHDASVDLSGPYIARGTEDGGLDVYPVYRLYPDTYRTFVYGMYKPVDQWAKTEGVRYRTFRKMDRMGNLLIPVPSRMYGVAADGALAGRRIGVKDLFDVKGVTTGAGSRAYAALYGDARKTASSLVTLEQLGGEFVGKTKTASFAAGSRGNGDTVDEQYPFSARGDGWQTCLGSSSGSGCAMGAYDWLDVGIGSDTGGSVRGPAAITGLYGNRPSTGAIALDGTVPMSNYADTAGILVRDPALFTALNRIWLGNSSLDLAPHTRTPQALHVPHNWIQQRTRGAQAVMVNFLARAQTALNLNVIDYPLDDILAKQDWTGDFDDPVVRAFLRTNRWGSWDQVGRRFKSEYRAEYSGQDPLLDPWIREMWEGEEVLDQELGKQEYAENVATMQEWSEWFHREVLPGNDETCSDGILVYDTGTKGLPLYRENELNEGVIPPRIIDPGSLFCSIAGCVDFTIPIGQAPYTSLISKVEEQQPVTISLVARRGCDLMLLDFVDKLAEAGLVGTVKAGRTAF